MGIINFLKNIFRVNRATLKNNKQKQTITKSVPENLKILNNKKTFSSKNSKTDSGNNLNFLDAKIKFATISDAIPQEQTLYKLSKFFSNFSDNTRLKIISCLSFGELCVGDISKILNMNQTTISHQLAFLKQSGTVDCRRDGKTIYYFLATSEIEECLTCGANFIAM